MHVVHCILWEALRARTVGGESTHYYNLLVLLYLIDLTVIRKIEECKKSHEEKDSSDEVDKIEYEQVSKARSLYIYTILMIFFFFKSHILGYCQMVETFLVDSVFNKIAA